MLSPGLLFALFASVILVLLQGHTTKAQLFSCVGEPTVDIDYCRPPTAQDSCSAMTSFFQQIWSNPTDCTTAICLALAASNGCNCWSDCWGPSCSQGLFRISPRTHAGRTTPGKNWRCPEDNQNNDWYNPTMNAQCAYIIWNNMNPNSWTYWSYLEDAYHQCLSNPVAATGCACAGYQTTTQSTTTNAVTSTAQAVTTTNAAAFTTIQAALDTTSAAATTTVAAIGTTTAAAVTTTQALTTEEAAAATTTASASTTFVSAATTSALSTSTTAQATLTVAASLGNAQASSALTTTLAETTTAATAATGALSLTTTEAVSRATSAAFSTTASASFSALAAGPSTTVAAATASSSLSATTSLATTSGGIVSPCIGDPPVYAAVCVNGTWIVTAPVVNTNNTVVVITTPVIFLGNVSLSGPVLIDKPYTVPLTVYGCVNVSGQLNVTLPDPADPPSSIHLINSSCVSGSFSTVYTDYKSKCKRQHLHSNQQTSAGHGLDLLLTPQGECKDGFPWFIVAVVVAVALLLALALIVAIVLMLRKRPGLLRVSDKESIHFKLMEENWAPTPPPPGTGTMPYNKTLPRAPERASQPPPRGDSIRSSLLENPAAEPVSERFSTPLVWNSLPATTAAVAASADETNRSNRMGENQLFTSPWSGPRISKPPPTMEAPAPPSLPPSLPQENNEAFMRSPAPVFESADAEPDRPSRISMPPPSNLPPEPDPDQRLSLLMSTILASGGDDRYSSESFRSLLEPLKSATTPAAAEEVGAHDSAVFTSPFASQHPSIQAEPQFDDGDEENNLLAAIAESDAALNDDDAGTGAAAAAAQALQPLPLLGPPPVSSDAVNDLDDLLSDLRGSSRREPQQEDDDGGLV